MLVSILLRLAICETMCAECGFMALDEPTIFLDRDHVDCLADALSSLVEMRSEEGGGKGRF